MRGIDPSRQQYILANPVLTNSQQVLQFGAYLLDLPTTEKALANPIASPVFRSVERWPSGLRHTLAKGACGRPYRGFESHPLRHPIKFSFKNNKLKLVVSLFFFRCVTSRSHYDPRAFDFAGNGYMQLALPPSFTLMLCARSNRRDARSSYWLSWVMP